jgi:hypothetical protein
MGGWRRHHERGRGVRPEGDAPVADQKQARYEIAQMERLLEGAVDTASRIFAIGARPTEL